MDDRPQSHTAAAGESGTSRQVIAEEVLPLIDESLTVHRRTVETGTVRVRTVLQQREELAKAEIYRHSVSVEHVPINREINEVPEPWQDGEVLVIPIVEEVLVVEKRLILREEVRIHRRREVEHVEQPVSLRSMEALVERRALATDTPVAPQAKR
jgi:uncharacterized protein (TIGR02271 family)